MPSSGIKKVDISSCQAGFPVSLSCTATSTTTTASYVSGSTTAAADKTVWWNEVRFIDAPSGGQAYMSANGKNTYLGNEYNLAFNAGPF